MNCKKHDKHNSEDIVKALSNLGITLNNFE